MSYLRGPDRHQVELLPATVEEYVAAEAPVRFIDAFAEGLDVKTLGFQQAQPASTGRPGYHPGDMVRLYLYGYLNRIRSSRRLEAEATRNLEVIWLLRGLRPDFKTIADFRKNNRACFKPLFRQFNVLCRQLGLFGAELVAIDGSKFKAVNNRARNFRRAELAELLQKIDVRIEEYLRGLEQQDRELETVAGNPSSQELQTKLAQLQERQGKYQELLKEMAAAEQTEVSLTDPDSRMQKKVGVGYNVQAAVDARHHLIVEQAVVPDANDRRQLSALAKAAKAELGVAQLKVVADAGYHEVGQLAQSEQAGIETYVSVPGTISGRSHGGKMVYPKERFRYDATADGYHCPAGQMLKRGHESQSKGKLRIDYYNTAACRGCALKSECTVARYRKLSRRPDEAVAERQNARAAAHPEILKKRKTIVEHVFGTLRNWEHDKFLLRGLAKVRAELSLSCLAYNLRRVLSLVSLDAWTTALKALTRAAQTATV
jgi:transposase